MLKFSIHTNIDTNKPTVDNVNCCMTVLGNLLSLNNGGTLIPAFIMQVYLTAILSSNTTPSLTGSFPFTSKAKFIRACDSLQLKTFTKVMCLCLHLTSPSAEVLLTVTLWIKQGQWFWKSYLVSLLLLLIAVTCLHELGKSEIFDVHYRYEIAMHANIYTWFPLESLKSHLVLWYYTPLRCKALVI